MNQNTNWTNFLIAIRVGSKDQAKTAMQDMAKSIPGAMGKRASGVKSRTAPKPVEVPDYIQAHVDYCAERNKREIAEYKDFLAAEERMHPHMRQSLDRSCNPALNVTEWMTERGD